MKAFKLSHREKSNSVCGILRRVTREKIILDKNSFCIFLLRLPWHF